jgi:hypothetical protein
MPQAREALGATPLSRTGKVKALTGCYLDVPAVARSASEEDRLPQPHRFRMSLMVIDEGRVWNVVLVCSSEQMPSEVWVLDLFAVGGNPLQ